MGYAYVNNTYAKVGNTLGWITPTQAFMSATGGTITTNGGPVDIAENGFQIAIVDGDNYYLYVYEDDTFSQYIPDGWRLSRFMVDQRNLYIVSR